MNPTTSVPVSLAHTPLANIPMTPARPTVRRSRLAALTTPTAIGTTRAISALVQAGLAFTAGGTWTLTLMGWTDSVAALTAVLALVMAVSGMAALATGGNPYLTVVHKALTSIFLSATGATLLAGAMVALMAGTWANLAILTVAAVAAITTSAYTQATN